MISLPIISAIYFLLSGIFCLSINISKSSVIFFLFCLTTFFWQFLWSILFSIKDYDAALLLAKIGYSFIIFIPSLFYHFLCLVSNNDKKERKFIIISYIISILLLFTMWLSNYFISDLYQNSWGFYPKASIIHPVHLLQTSLFCIRGLYLIYKKTKYLYGEKYNYYLVAMISYFFASSDYLLNYGLNFYPVGVVFIMISNTIILCGILENRIFNKALNNFKNYGHKIANTTRNSLKSIDKISSIVRHNFRNYENNYNIDIKQDMVSIPIDNYKDGMMFLDLMSQTSKKGNNIINLIINNIGKDKIEKTTPTKIEISEIMDNVLSEYHIDDHDISLIDCKINKKFYFLGDQYLFTYVIFNLLKNSLIYRGKIEIYTAESKNYNLLFFKNYKSSIPEIDIKSIFKDHSNVKSSTKSKFSLGLPFCKKIMNSFEGDIKCTSKEGQNQWTEFVLSFPIIK
ncbi:ATP-binding protein [Rickettsiales bacterium]|nr:ATP-binding protein [Rickettsiales bacterium]